jgi:hypothetical protein
MLLWVAIGAIALGLVVAIAASAYLLKAIVNHPALKYGACSGNWACSGLTRGSGNQPATL